MCWDFLDGGATFKLVFGDNYAQVRHSLSLIEAKLKKRKSLILKKLILLILSIFIGFNISATEPKQ